MNPFHNRQDEWELYEPLQGKRMLELGGKVNAGITYKSYFESLGFEHVSLDWNGQHGALERDLRDPLWHEFAPFDMVANMGCTEHVSEQKGVWENIHRLTKVGGVYVGQTPYHDGKSWWWHGMWYPTEEFFQAFAELNGWRVDRIYKGRERPNENLYCRMTKLSDSPFVMPEGLIKRNQIKPRAWNPA